MGSQSALPLQHFSMTGARDFFANLARAGTGYKDIKETVEAAYGNESLQKTAIYATTKKGQAGESTTDTCHFNPKKTVRTPDFVTSVNAACQWK